MTTAPQELQQAAQWPARMRVGQVFLPGELAVIVPCYNEAEGIGNLQAGLRRLRAALEGQSRLELLLVDDGSSDDTLALLHEHFGGQSDITILHHPANRGIAAAIATGLAHARADVAASLDADCTYDPLQIVQMARLLTDGVDLVVASPYHPQGNVIGVPRWRLGLSQAASRIYRCLLRNKLHTYTSCVRVYRRSAVEELPLRHGGFAGVVELVCRLDHRGGTIVEYPAVLTVRMTGQSKMRIARTIAAHLKLMAWAVWLRGFGLRGAPARRLNGRRRHCV
jgi:dolichol-phosphate mannosyltransferase